MKKVMKRNDIAIYWLENQNPFFLICPWQGVHFTELVNDGVLTIEKAAEKASMSVEAFRNVMKNIYAQNWKKWRREK